MKYLGKVLPHFAMRGDEEGVKLLVKDYTQTLSLYRKVFSVYPNQQIWDKENQRFHKKYQTYRYISLFRLSALYSLKTLNPQAFNTSEDYKVEVEEEQSNQKQKLDV